MQDLSGTAPSPPSSLARASGRYRRRKIVNGIATGVMFLCALAALIPLFIITYFVIQQGGSALVEHLSTVFTEHVVQGQDTGQNLLIDGIKGTALLIVVSSAIGIPIGLLSGIYLAEYGRNRFGDIVRFVTDIMAGVPSIVAGLVAYQLLVVTTGHYSVFAGGMALGLLMFPTVTRATESVILLVPASLREGGLALGMRNYRVIISVVVPAAIGGIMTGIILGIARVSGETAPLIFTIFGNTYGWQGWTQPLSALPLQIYTFLFSPPDDPAADQQYAFAAVMVLFTLVLVLNLLARYLAARQSVTRS
jgi:phosphate transport system permease protein